MPNTHQTPKASLSFAKLVATPTETAWSQAYNAGNLFVCLTLTKQDPEDTISLQTIGKESINSIESEFFTLEVKNTKTIKQALLTSLNNIPEGVDKDITVALCKDDVLTVFVAGSGKVIIKREEKLGTILERHEKYIDGKIDSAAGYLNNKDIIILESGQFAKKITDSAIHAALELSLPIDIVETLTPQIHGQEDGGQSAIVILYQTAQSPKQIDHNLTYPEDQSLASLYTSTTRDKDNDPTLEETIEESTPSEEYSGDADKQEHKSKRKHILKKLHIPRPPHFAIMKSSSIKLNHKRKLYLTIAAILSLLLVISIFMAISKERSTAQKTIFNQTYLPAKQYYDEGIGLKSLNQALSQESFKKAEKKLQEGEEKIDRDSPEGQQIQQLLTKVEDELKGVTTEELPSSDSQEKPITPKQYSFLHIQQSNKNGAFAQDAKNVYMVDTTAIYAFSKTTGAKKELHKNETDWTSPKALAPYQTNLYVLDTKDIHKITAGGDISSYFNADKPDIAKAVAVAIDGSVWVLNTDGSILKFTRGKKEHFEITGLSKHLNSPTKLFTDITSSSLYILDNGNGRIVQLSKKGVFQKEYTSPVISRATDFDINEATKKAYILSQNNVYEIAL